MFEIGTEVWSYIVMLFPSISGVIATVLGAIFGIKKLKAAAEELKNSREMRELVESLRVAHVDNKRLKKINEKLIEEISRIKGCDYIEENEEA